MQLDPDQSSGYRQHVQSLSERVLAEFGFYIQLCAETECYITGLPVKDTPFLHVIIDECEARDIPLESVTRERGAGQYEFRLSPTSPVHAIDALVALRSVIAQQAKAFKGSADFSANPVPGAPPSGLHWHLHLENAQRINVFLKHEQELTPPLSATLGGLLKTMPALMTCFMPSDTSYTRLASRYDHIPTTVSWGGNNRSVALRMPESVVPVRHIEHRVCGADADPAQSVWAILVGIHYGLTHRPDPGPQLYGNADDAQYEMPLLPLNSEAARLAASSADWLEAYKIK